MELVARRSKTKENNTEGLTEISSGAEDLAESSNGEKRGKAEESGFKDLVKNNKKLGAKEGEEETEDLVKGNKGGEEMRNSNNDLAEISKLRDGPMSLGSVTNHAEWR